MKERDRLLIDILEKMNNQMEDIFDRIKTLGAELGQHVSLMDLKNQSKEIQDSIDNLYYMIDEESRLVEE